MQAPHPAPAPQRARTASTVEAPPAMAERTALSVTTRQMQTIIVLFPDFEIDN
jgi:hypothetical protein